MALPPLFLVEKAAALEIEELLPEVLEGSLSENDVIYFCGLYRRFGISKLLFSGAPDEFYQELFKAGRAYLDYIRRVGRDAVLTSKGAPFFDAVACNDLAGAGKIAEAVNPRWREGEEYEEDFLYVRFLMQRFFLDADATALEQGLARYEEVLDGQTDPRLELSRAILATEERAFDQALSVLLSNEQARLQGMVEGEKLDPDDASTVARVSVEGVALVRLGEQLGFGSLSEYPLVPDVARMFSRAVHPAPDSWRAIESYASL